MLQKGTEIVISYAGTDPDARFPFSPDWVNNIALYGGTWAEQLLQACEYYLQVKLANPDATITLTGHSLGGGLAALVAVFFNEQARVFDQAPFASSAQAGSATAVTLMQRLQAIVDSNGTPIYQALLAPLSNYLFQRGLNGGNTFIPREGNVQTLRVDGESLQGGAGRSPIGTELTPIDTGLTGSVKTQFAGELHSQALLTAFLQSQQSALAAGTADKTFNKVTYKLPELLSMLFDEKKLFAAKTSSAVVNLLDHLVRHEAGVQGSITADAMVTRFTADLWKLAQDGGMTLTDGVSGAPDLRDLSKALIAFAMQFDSVVGANGAVITLAEGQTQVSFALVQQGEVTANGSLQLSATYASANQSASSNAWTINLQDAGAIDQTMSGDQRAKIIGVGQETQFHITADKPSYGTYAWGETSWAADGSLHNGLAAADFSDVLDGRRRKSSAIKEAERVAYSLTDMGILSIGSIAANERLYICAA